MSGHQSSFDWPPEGSVERSLDLSFTSQLFFVVPAPQQNTQLHSHTRCSCETFEMSFPSADAGLILAFTECSKKLLGHLKWSSFIFIITLFALSFRCMFQSVFCVSTRRMQKRKTEYETGFFFNLTAGFLCVGIKKGPCLHMVQESLKEISRKFKLKAFFFFLSKII